jgi:hypothetical protein
VREYLLLPDGPIRYVQGIHRGKALSRVIPQYYDEYLRREDESRITAEQQRP